MRFRELTSFLGMGKGWRVTTVSQLRASLETLTTLAPVDSPGVRKQGPRLRYIKTLAGEDDGGHGTNTMTLLFWVASPSDDDDLAREVTKARRAGELAHVSGTGGAEKSAGEHWEKRVSGLRMQFVRQARKPWDGTMHGRELSEGLKEKSSRASTSHFISPSSVHLCQLDH